MTMALYPVFVHNEAVGDSDVAVSGEIPDFRGCFVAADTWEAFPGAVQEAAEVYFEGEDMEIPAPSPLDALQRLDEYQDGQWVFVDIDTSRLNTTKERVNLSIPGYALREIDDYARRLGENRSRFLYTTALKLIRGQIGTLDEDSGRARGTRAGARSDRA
jgi:predicted RNase H-like HicB family nuclease